MRIPQERTPADGRTWDRTRERSLSSSSVQESSSSSLDGRVTAWTNSPRSSNTSADSVIIYPVVGDASETCLVCSRHVADGPRTRRRGSSRLFAAVAVLAVSSLGAATSATSADAVPANRVTVITDSVGGVLFWATEARVKLGRGLDLDLETKTCRKLVDPGCPSYGDPAPASSALDTILALGPQLGPTVVIDVGYNDQAVLYAAQLEQVMKALLAAGVQHVVWVTLAEAQEPWARINTQIRAASKRWPQLAVADWAMTSAGKPWFVDGAHMTYEGGLAFAEFLRPFVLQACGQPCAPPPPLEITTLRLPPAHRQHRYAIALAAQGGVPPYRWSGVGVPRGFRLSIDGRVTGIPRTEGVSRIRLSVRDAWEEECVLDLGLRVRS